MKRNIYDICDVIERAKKGKIYPAGTVLIQLDATKGEVLRLLENETVDTKYACLIPKENENAEYFFRVIEGTIDGFCETYQTGINLQFDVLKNYNVEYSKNEDEQKSFCERISKLDDLINFEEGLIEGWQNTKKYFLEKMFPSTYD